MKLRNYYFKHNYSINYFNTMRKLFKFISLLLSSCTASVQHSAIDTSAEDDHSDTPLGLTVIEQSPKYLFIRLSSPEQLSASDIQTVVQHYNGRYDRIDFCLDSSHERGEEYLSISDSTIFDHRTNSISLLSDI